MNDQRERDNLQNDRALGLRDHGEWVDGDGHRCPLSCNESMARAVVLRRAGDADEPAKRARAIERLSADVGCTAAEAAGVMDAVLANTGGVDLNRIIRVLDWLVADCTWRNWVDRPDGAMYGDDGNYGPELRDAITLLADLRRIAGEPENGRTNLTAGEHDR